MDITELLELRSWRALDVDDRGRVLATHDETGSPQLVLIEADGTLTALTALPGPCTGRWLPGRADTVLVSHDTGGDENAQLSQLSLTTTPLPATLDDLKPLVREPGVKHTVVDVAPGRLVYSTNRRNRVDFDVVSRDLPTGAETVVYDGGGSVESVVVAADGSAAVIGLTGARAISTQLLHAAPGRPVRALTPPDLPARHEHAALTPDGTGVVVTTDRGRDTTGVARLDLSTGAWTWLVTDDEHDLACWPSPDGRRLLVETRIDGESRLALHDGDGALVHLVGLPGQGSPGAGVLAMGDPVWSPDGASVALSHTSPSVPGDVLLLSAATGAVRTAAASTALAEPALPSTHRVPAPDGEAIPCFVFAPPSGHGDGASAVLVVHGGPEGEADRTFSPVVQALAAAGHTVLVPNVRGSAGYGRRWTSLDDVELRLDSVADLAALHAWLPAIGVDPARAALYGGSYGGYMVLAGLTMQPDLWAAGVDIVGISSLVTFLENTSPYRRAAREREYGSLARDRDFLNAASPMTHIDAIRAPLFVIHGANDPRVPLSETEQLVAAVRDRGVECELVVYPDEGHGLARRVNRLDAYPRALSFVDRHLAAGGPS